MDGSCIIVVNNADGKKYKMMLKGDMSLLTIGKVKRYLHTATGAEPASQMIRFNNQALSDGMTGSELGLYDGAVLMLDIVAPPPQPMFVGSNASFGSMASPSGNNGYGAAPNNTPYRGTNSIQPQPSPVIDIEKIRQEERQKIEAERRAREQQELEQQRVIERVREEERLRAAEEERRDIEMARIREQERQKVAEEQREEERRLRELERQRALQQQREEERLQQAQREFERQRSVERKREEERRQIEAQRIREEERQKVLEEQLEEERRLQAQREMERKRAQEKQREEELRQQAQQLEAQRAREAERMAAREQQLEMEQQELQQRQAAIEEAKQRDIEDLRSQQKQLSAERQRLELERNAPSEKDELIRAQQMEIEHLRGLQQEKIYARSTPDENVRQSLAGLARELQIPPLELDMNQTCAITLDDGKFNVLLTYDPATQRLYQYATILNSLPTDQGVRMQLYEALLEGALLGRDMCGGGVGISTKNNVVLLSASLDMGFSDPEALAAMAKPFLEALRKWNGVIETILVGDNPHHRRVPTLAGASGINSPLSATDAPHSRQGSPMGHSLPPHSPPSDPTPHGSSTYAGRYAAQQQSLSGRSF